MIEKLNIKGRKHFKRMFETYQPQLCFFAAKYLSDGQMCRDLVQDVFLDIWLGRIDVKSEKTLKSFLYTIVRNRCFDHIKLLQKRGELSSDDFALEQSYSLENEILEVEVYYKVHNAIKKLSPQAQKIIRLAMNSSTNSEIAEELKVSINTVKTVKKRAYSLLRKDLSGADLYTAFFLLLSNCLLR